MVENSMERSSKKSPAFKEFEEKKEQKFIIDPAHINTILSQLKEGQPLLLPQNSASR